MGIPTYTMETPSSNMEVSPDNKPYHSEEGEDNLGLKVSQHSVSDPFDCLIAQLAPRNLVCQLGELPHFSNPAPLLATAPTSTSISPTIVASHYQPTLGHETHLWATRPMEGSQIGNGDGSGGHIGQVVSDGGRQPEEEGAGQERQAQERQAQEERGQERGQVSSQEQEELDRLYEERMEEEYAKREGGA